MYLSSSSYTCCQCYFELGSKYQTDCFAVFSNLFAVLLEDTIKYCEVPLKSDLPLHSNLQSLQLHLLSHTKSVQGLAVFPLSFQHRSF